MNTTIKIIVLAFLLSGCINTKKATDYLKDKGQLAAICADEYPVRDSVIYQPGDTIINTEILPGDTLVYHDTIWRNQYSYRIDTIRKACPAKEVITKVVHDTVRVYQRDTAKESALQNELKECIEEARKKERKGSIWMWVAIAVAVVGFAYSFIKR